MSDSERGNLERIPDPPAPPVEDSLSRQEELELTTGKHLKLSQRERIDDLRRQVRRLEARESDLSNQVLLLQDAKFELAKYSTKDRMQKIVVVICALGIGSGGLMTSSATDWVSYFGYALAAVCLAIETFLGLFDPRSA